MTQAIHVANRDVKEKELRFYRQGSSRENNRGNLNRAEKVERSRNTIRHALLHNAIRYRLSLNSNCWVDIYLFPFAKYTNRSMDYFYSFLSLKTTNVGRKYGSSPYQKR